MLGYVDEKLKSTQVATVWSDKKGKQIPVSASSVRRCLKRKFPDEPSMVAARPKGMRVGGNTAHHNKCRLMEARYWKSQGQDVVDGIFFADETKIAFREHKNKQIDIEWVYRGTASEFNWYEKMRWPGTINLFLMMSKDGIELTEIYHKNLNLARYKELLPAIGDAIQQSDVDFSVYMHDNCWRGTQPVEELNEFLGRGRWTQYMGKPCRRNHPTLRTPVRKLPVKVPRKRCGCDFPDGPIHAAFNPKMNLAEETFAQLDRIMTKNKIKDEKKKPGSWILKGAGKKKFWVKQLKKAIRQLNKDKDFFINQYNGYLKRCDAYIRSRGKRLKTSKW